MSHKRTEERRQESRIEESETNKEEKKMGNQLVDRAVVETNNTEFSYLNGECLESAAYNHALKQLFVTFRESGNTYRYYEVASEKYIGLQRAKSAGKYYNQEIKGSYKSEIFC